MAVPSWGRVVTRVIAVGLVLALVTGVGWLYLRGDLNGLICDGPCPPRYATVPQGVTQLDPEPVETPSAPKGAIDEKALEQAVEPALASANLGDRVGFAAVDARDGTPLAGGDENGYTPASTTKVLTAFAAVDTLGPTRRFSTTVVRDEDSLTLVGGGDPYLSRKRSRDEVSPASLEMLADRVAENVDRGRYTLTYDASLFAGPAVNPHWEDGYVPSVVTPISALWADQGRRDGGRAMDPAAEAAETFAEMLRNRGVEVTSVRSGDAPSGASPVARVRSAPVAAIVEELLATSDNEASEVVLRHVARASGEQTTFDGGVRAVHDRLERAAISVSGLKLQDGSGLARGNRISPTTLVQTLVAASQESSTQAVLDGLPVVGFNGTVRSRFAQSSDGVGWVRAKTGTLTGAHSLAGIATLPGGRPVAFAVLADDTEHLNAVETEAAVDAVAAAVAGCTCSR